MDGIADIWGMIVLRQAAQGLRDEELLNTVADGEKIMASKSDGYAAAS